MLLDVDVALRLDIGGELRIQELAFETDQPIDNLRIRFSGGRTAFLQIKRSISLSALPESDFVKTIDQFLRQYLAKPYNDDVYILATSSDASNKIVRELRKILGSIRLNDVGFNDNPLSKTEQKTLATYREVVNSLFNAVNNREMTDIEFLDFSSHIYINILDVEHDMPLEKAAIVLLSKESTVNPRLLWALLIQSSLHYASERLSVTPKSLSQNIAKYLRHENGGESPIAPDEVAISIMLGGEIAAGRT